MSDQDLWRDVLNRLQTQMPKKAFETWLANTAAGRDDQGVLTIYTPSIYALDWLSNRLHPLIKAAVAATLGESLPIAFAIRQAEQRPDPRPAPLPDDDDLFDLLRADDILTTDWPEPVYAAPDLIPTGLSILAGRPKIGKSWLALQLALAVGSGGLFLGKVVERGAVLYLALEDPPARLKERMRLQGWPPGLVVDFMVLGQFRTQIDELQHDGAYRLAAQIRRRQYRLVIIDTLSRAIGGDQNDVEIMTRALTPLQEISHATNCAILLLDHHTKAGGRINQDVIADILGSTAKGAMADTALGLYRDRDQKRARLAVTGRDVLERTLALTMNLETGTWQLDGDAAQIELTERQQEVLDAIELLGEATPLEISETIGMRLGTVSKILKKLVENGLVVQHRRKRKAFYTLPDSD